jgi:hypothetical protein
MGYRRGHRMKIKCKCCGLDIDDKWIYYEYGNLIICHFCYKMLERKGDE